MTQTSSNDSEVMGSFPINAKRGEVPSTSPLFLYPKRPSSGTKQHLSQLYGSTVVSKASNRIDDPDAALSPQAPSAKSLVVRVKSPNATSRALIEETD